MIISINESNRQEYYDLAHKINIENNNKNFEFCSIINAKSGLCSEDCKWCAQSRHHSTSVETYDIISKEKCVQQALHLESRGITRFSLVTSGKRLSTKELDKIIENVKAIKKHSKIKICASLGLLNLEEMVRIKDAGVERYHCNLETTSEYFDTLYTTHSHNDKKTTLKAAQNAGMDICCGGIIGMGETAKQRSMFANEIKAVGSLSIPINILQTIPGTPLAKQEALSQKEILDSIAIMRITNPKARIRFAAGRSLLTDNSIKIALYLGIDSAITGDFLTTTGSTIDDDFENFSNI